MCMDVQLKEKPIEAHERRDQVAKHVMLCPIIDDALVQQESRRNARTADDPDDRGTIIIRGRECNPRIKRRTREKRENGIKRRKEKGKELADE